MSNDFISYASINEEMIRNYPLIINCTPVGMFPNNGHQPLLPYHFMNHQNLLFDLIYRPEMTKFLQSGLDKGATIKNGYEMLVIQAEENWRIWNEESKAFKSRNNA